MHIDMLASIVEGYEKACVVRNDRLIAAIHSRDPRLIKSITLDPSSYGSSYDFSLDYMLANAFRKYKGFSSVSDEDRQKTALDSWLAAENRCALFNKGWYNGSLEREGSSPFILKVKSLISHVLGRFSLSRALRDCRHGTGATATVKRRSGIDKKIASKLSVGRRASPYLRLVLSNDPHYFYSRTGVFPEGPYTYIEEFDIVDSNRLEFVPKDSLTDRPISCEPTGNCFLQLSVGSYLKGRLSKVGIDLTDQSVNQRLARLARIQELCTLDLSSASDTLSFGLVKFLLPEDWFNYLNDIRSPSTSFKGKEIHLNKFSSMGNGFTFELETLIFWAVAVAASEELLAGSPLVSVYGDDIIVEARCYDNVVDRLHQFGFVVNNDKSFQTGPFFESCGRHYFNTFDVTPFFQKEVVSSPDELIRAHNRLLRWTKKIGVTRHFGRALRLLLISWPYDKVPRIPDVPSSNDDGFLTDTDRLGPHDRNHGFWCYVFIAVAKKRRSYFEDSLYWYCLSENYKSPHPKGWAVVDTYEKAYKLKCAYRQAY